MSNVPAPKPFKLSHLILSVYLPSFAFSIGEGAVLPVIPLFAKDLGASVALASLIVAMRGIGTLFMDLPGGVFVSKFGDKGAMFAGTALVGVVAVGVSFSNSPIVLAVLMVIMGGGWAFWQLARISYVSVVTPIEQRGRVISMIGGVNRAGTVIGPILGGAIGAHFGLEYAFYVQAIAGVVAAALTWFSVDDSEEVEDIGTSDIAGRLYRTVRDHRKVFVATLLPLMALAVLRQGRQVFLPLWGDEIGLDVAKIGLVYGLSFFLDAMMFYPVGLVMDRYGRKWAGVPCLFTLGAGLILLTFTNELWTFVAISFLTGLGNGFGAGIMMTLGADFSPREGRGEFLGVWRLIGDFGAAGGPLAISAIIGVLSLAAAAIATGGFGLIGGVLMILFVPETLKRTTKVVAESDAIGSPAR